MSRTNRVQRVTGEVTAGAILSDDGRYRYVLTRSWDPLMLVKRSVTFVMVNPSTADATEDDATIRKCMGFARRWGFNAIEVVNLFAFRSTEVSELKKLVTSGKIADAIGGGDCDGHIRLSCAGADEVICGWGNETHKAGDIAARATAVYRMIRSERITARALLRAKVTEEADEAARRWQPKCLGINGVDGSPKHPLFIGYDTPIRAYDRRGVFA